MLAAHMVLITEAVLDWCGGAGFEVVIHIGVVDTTLLEMLAVMVIVRVMMMMTIP